MKKLFVLALLLTALLCACQKAESISEDITTKGLVTPDKPTVCCLDHENSIQSNGSRYCCDNGRGCAPCVVITPDPDGGEIKSANHLSMVSDLLGESPTEVVAFFAEKAYFEDIFPLLYGTEIHKRLCTGSYIMSDIIQAYHSNNRVFLFTNIEDNSTIAVPYAEE